VLDVPPLMLLIPIGERQDYPDVYSGLFDDDLDSVAERLDAAARVAVVPHVCPEASIMQLR
jgi:hypothetical protein